MRLVLLVPNAVRHASFGLMFTDSGFGVMVHVPSTSLNPGQREISPAELKFRIKTSQMGFVKQMKQKCLSACLDLTFVLAD